MTDEIRGIVAEYDQGVPWRGEIERDLPGFLARHRTHIAGFRATVVERLVGASPAEPRLSPDDLWEIAVKLYVLLVVQSISTETENWAQIKEVEISKWLWCEQAKTTMTLEEAMARWSETCAEGWRGKRVLQICYVFHRGQERLLPLLRGTAPQAPPSAGS